MAKHFGRDEVSATLLSKEASFPDPVPLIQECFVASGEPDTILFYTDGDCDQQCLVELEKSPIPIEVIGTVARTSSDGKRVREIARQLNATARFLD